MLGVGGARGERGGGVESQHWCSDLRALASTCGDVLFWRVWKLLKIIFGGLSFGCAYKLRAGSFCQRWPQYSPYISNTGLLYLVTGEQPLGNSCA